MSRKKGFKHSKETIIKMKETMKRRIKEGKFVSIWADPEFRKNNFAWKKGRKHTPETIQKMKDSPKKRKLAFKKPIDAFQGGKTK